MQKKDIKVQKAVLTCSQKYSSLLAASIMMPKYTAKDPTASKMPVY